MKSKNIHNLVIEGPDGVGKTTLIKGLFKHYNYRYMLYHRGEISNYIFAKKYNRTYYVTQNNLPFLYIVLICSKETLKNRILQRAKDESWVQDDLTEEISKVNDVDEFLDAVEKMKNEYEIVVINTDGLDAHQTLMKVVEYLDKRFEALPKDDESTYTQWNKIYKKGCDALGIKFDVIDNQPYFNGIPANCETTLQNGAYETFTHKEVPTNLVFTLGYGVLDVNNEKTHDFEYVINSKILKRPEVFEYYDAIERAGLTCITSNFEAIRHYKGFERHDRIFGVDYLNVISHARATIYTAREVEYMKIQTGRLYEGIIANTVVFVDELSDLNRDILRNIYGDNDELINLLTIKPENIIEKYNKVFSDEKLVDFILKKQHEYLEKLINALRGDK